VSVLDIQTSGFVPVKQMDHCGGRPMRYVEIIEDNSFAKVAIP